MNEKVRSKVFNTKFVLSEKDREYFRLYKKKYREDGREKNIKPSYRKNYQRDYQRVARFKVIEHYGGKCICCLESDFRFLAVDHIHGDGSKHRKEKGTKNIATWIIRNDFPENMFQILCHNCNMAKQFYGECPHKSNK